MDKFTEETNKLIKEAIHKGMENKECLVAHFIKENPELPVEGIEIIEEFKNGTYRTYVRRREV